MPTILTNSSLSWTTRFSLNTTPKKFILTYVDVFTAASIPLTGVRGVFTITAPSGTVIYSNSSYGASSDIVANVSLANALLLPLPNLSNQSPEQGEYTISSTCQIIDGVNPTYYITATNTYNYTYDRPTADIDTEVDCISPLITGQDNTDYVVNSVTPTNARTFVLQYPTGSGGTDITNTTSATITTSTFYTGTQTFTLTSILTYAFSNFSVVDTITGTKAITVDCTFVCNLYCCLKSLEVRKNNARGVNQVLFEELSAQFNEVMAEVQFLFTAIDCGKQEDANATITKIKSIAECTDDCSCNDGTPVLVQGLGLQNVNVVVQSGGSPITVTSSVAGGVTTYTVSFSAALVTKINASYNTVVAAGTGISVADSGVVNDVRTFTITNTVTAQNRLEFLCRLQFANFAVPIVTITNSAYLTSGSNMVGTAAVTATDIANPNWATMNNLFTCTTFQTAANNNYKVTMDVTVQGADFTLAGGFGTWSAAQMKSLSDQLQPQILDKSSGSFKFRLVVGADAGVGLPLSNKFMVVYPDIYVMIKISE